MKRALLSVSDKRGLIPFAQGLINQGFELISTGGTYRQLHEAGIAVKEVAEITQFPEMLDGRVKTLHPRIHAGLLAIRNNEEHMAALQEHQIEPIDLVVVNLYPFKATIAKPGVTLEEAIEQIDIGGPSMLRAAAKNYQDVTVICDPNDYEELLQALEAGEVSLELRRKYATKVFRHTAAYDAIISQYLNQQVGEALPDQLTLTWEKVEELRYGENPHQQAAFYRLPFPANRTLAAAKQLHGKALSYNNLQDANAAWRMVSHVEKPAVVAVKHMNPCGFAMGKNLLEAYLGAYEADPVSIFGGIIATNQVVDGETAAKMKEIFLEIILAPSFTEEALEILQTKKNLRLLEMGSATEEGFTPLQEWQLTAVRGGILVQEWDEGRVNVHDAQVVTERKPSEEEYQQLQIGWEIVKHVKSNAIVLVKDGRTVGIGAGQMNRVGSAKIAIEQAGELTKGAILASDAFFPMPDTLEAAAAAGITAIVQPGGSIRDQDSIDAANQHGIAMIFTGMRHFKH